MLTKKTRIVALLGFLLQAASGIAANEFHPEFPLLDQSGLKVIDSGQPLSTLKTCGSCHDSAFIEAHSDHANAGAAQVGKAPGLHPWDAGPGFFGSWNPIDNDNLLDPADPTSVTDWLASSGSRHAGGGPIRGIVEMNCLLCHSNIDKVDARNRALADRDFEWANSSVLTGLGVIERSRGEWRWNPELFKPDGSLVKGLLDINKPADENCALCHGYISNELEQPLVLKDQIEGNSMTARTGQIISPQRIASSGLNIRNKKSLNRAFDIHSDRVLGCVSCHYSINNPVYFQRGAENQPGHLIFDPRRLTSADYLKRPLHQFAKGNSTHGLSGIESQNSLRPCQSCHQAEMVHGWLPFKTRHFEALACESCHIPQLYGPALKVVDWSMLDAQGKPLLQYRNTTANPSETNSMLSGFEPILLPRTQVDGKMKLAPFNLVSSWYWTAGSPERPVQREALIDAFFNNGEVGDYQSGLIESLDDNRDGRLQPLELKLANVEKSDRIKALLESTGLQQVNLRAEINAFSINHNVANGEWATKSCQSCHADDSRVDAVFALSDYRPGELTPTASSDPGVVFSGSIEANTDGSIEFHADASQSGFYIIGRDGLGWIDVLGMTLFFGILLGVSGHGLARYITSRKRGPDHHQYHRKYIYDAYERLWHWLQAGSVLILLLTGIIIHKPHIFGIFSFAYIVQVHNVVGFILLINAAMALFYNLASGEIKQYIPEPKGFIGRSVAQALYYSKGIFEGKPHPLEKTREQKMNPLQQVTYLAILHILLPIQILSGLLIWGAQYWPWLAEFFGGFLFLAPVHTLSAWAFAAFIVMHVYLTTTGHTPTAGIQAMVEGWDEVEDAPH